MPNKKNSLSLAIATGLLMMAQAHAGDIENTLPAAGDNMTIKQGANELMRVQGDGKVGIGTQDPRVEFQTVGKVNIAPHTFTGEGHQLEVQSVTGNLANFYYADGSTNPRLYIKGEANKIRLKTSYSTGGGNLAFGTNSQPDSITIVENGNVGIGTAVPTAKLSITGVDQDVVLGAERNFPAMLQIHSTGYGVGSESNILFSSNYTTLATVANASIGAIQETTGNGQDYGQASLVFRTTGNTVASLNTERMRIDKSGNVGIGTVAPAPSPFNAAQTKTVLDISPTGKGAELRLVADGDMFADISLGRKNGSTKVDREWNFGVSSFGDLTIVDRGTEAAPQNPPTFVIQSTTGHIGIGADAGPDAMLEINNDGYTLDGTSDLLMLSSTENENGNYMIVKSNGNVGIGTTSPNTKLAVVGLPVHVDNAAALAASLVAGDFYRTAAGVLMVTF